ncbi:hypothetical protein FEM48_Zijuj01G0206500 [Ziziphus jujuba var. spinosa]|uniref:Uncharacterized protein n=1 Tax=Ziziphus jujuba var. spinosa TaxID=714518 RepID=A0A978W3F7_ZIZJJ|nr:hypothetical protein FEM48_Zijuj01G0206500 [Ziziphus jujuba var. spinosa]
MGIWDYICSWTDSLKRNAPDLTKIGNDANLQALKQNLPDDEGRQKIAQFTTCLAKNAAIETIKFVPGGDSVRKVVTKSYEEVYRLARSGLTKVTIGCLGSQNHEQDNLSRMLTLSHSKGTQLTHLNHWVTPVLALSLSLKSNSSRWNVRFVKAFLVEGDFHLFLPSRLNKVSELMDLYPAEVAPDSHLFKVFNISHASTGLRKTNS